MKFKRLREAPIERKEPPLLTEVVAGTAIPTLVDAIEPRSVSVSGREFAEFEARICEELARAVEIHGRFEGDTAELQTRLQSAIRRTLRDYFATNFEQDETAWQDIIPAPSQRSVVNPKSSIADPRSTSMPLSKSFEPHEIEKRWYALWEESGWFKPRAAGEAYCIMLPPPNVTGTLHMGHAFQHTLIDILIRWKRMEGMQTLWQPGTDHAGIATQIVVERLLESEGLSRESMGREAFLRRVWEWKKQSGATISQQMRRLGASCDWSRERFTLDEGLSRAVVEVFVKLYQEGLIYRGKRLVNWDPVLETAVSDLEVVSEEEDGFLWHIRYPAAHGKGGVTVATTRPETMLGDVAVAVSPNDARYSHLIGRKVKLPLTKRTIPVIADEYVDPDFGTGCLKITPAHDFNDYQVWLRHKDGDLKSAPLGGLISIFNSDATIVSQNEVAKLIPEAYRGLDRFVARAQIVSDLAAAHLLEKTEPHKLTVPRTERTRAVIEPMLTDQWFVRAAPLAQPALRAVESGELTFVPENWRTTYEQWLSNIQDWCISRQLWWGHRIPAWYDEDGNVYVARSAEDAQRLAPGRRLSQDEDVLDTWFSSALWPFSTLGWPEKTRELETFLPTSVLVTGFDIIFFWVARMVMMSLHFTGKVPFREVYVHGLVRDAEGQKMSKSKGNVLDPIDLIDGIGVEELIDKRVTGLINPDQAKTIEKTTRAQFPNGIPSFGADSLRFTFASLASFGRDIRFDLSRCEGYRNFCNKLWNAARFVLIHTAGRDLVLMHTAGRDRSAEQPLPIIDRWIVARLQQAESEVREALAEYRFDLAARAVYEFVWDEYCDWYLELAKVNLADEAAQDATRRTLVRVLETTLRLAHPIIPFITEELWQKLAPLAGKMMESIMLAPYPVPDPSRADEEASQFVARLKELVNACRQLRAELNVSPAQKMPLIAAGDERELEVYSPYLRALARISDVTCSELPASDAPVAVVGEFKLMLQITIDKDTERERLGKELARLENEIEKARTKLANPAFLEKAPPTIVAQERERLTGFRGTLEKVRGQLQKLD